MKKKQLSFVLCKHDENQCIGKVNIFFLICLLFVLKLHRSVDELSQHRTGKASCATAQPTSNASNLSHCGKSNYQ